MNIFDKWNDKVNASEMEASEKELKESGATRGEVPVGEYEVSIEKLEAKNSKSSGRPMITIWFNILEGDFKKSKIFYNQLFDMDTGRHIAVEMLSAILDNDDSDNKAMINSILKKCDVGTANELCMDIHEEIDGNFEYLLEYGRTSKGYNTYKIKEVYEA